MEGQPGLETKNETTLDTMTPEQREQFKAEWKNRCGGRWGRPEKTDAVNTMPTE